MDTPHFEHLESIFGKAHINTRMYPSAKLTVKEGYAEIEMEVSKNYHHGMNAMHGSVYFKLLDDAAYFAANSVVKDYFLVTTSFHIHLLRPVSSGIIRSRGTLRFRSPQLFIADAVILNAQGKEIAFGTGHFAKSKINLIQDQQ